jgi:hypothetical protein
VRFARALVCLVRRGSEAADARAPDADPKQRALAQRALREGGDGSPRAVDIALAAVVTRLRSP